MWNSDNDRTFITQMSKDIVAEISPEELDIFSNLAEDYYKNPTPAPIIQENDSPLGFGPIEIPIATSTVAMAMMVSVLSFILEMLKESIKDASADLIKEQLKEHIKGKKSQISLSLTSEQLRQTRQIALEEAKRYGMEETEAELLTRALISRLALSKSA